MKVLLALDPTVKLDPDPTKFIGGRVIQRIADGVAGQGLVLCVAILTFGAVMWALGGGRGNNVALGADGKTRVVIAAFAALLIAASPAIINFCIELGGQI